MIAQSSHFQTLEASVFNQIIHVYPTGEFTYRRTQPIQSKAKDTKQQRDDERFAQAIENAIDGQTVKCDRPRKSIRSKVGYGELAPKWSNFTRKARKQLRNSAAAMELEFTKENCKFITLTVPGSTPEATKVIAAHSGQIINWIQTNLGDNFKHSDGRKFVIGVAELQKRKMLHWHFLIALEDAGQVEILREHIEKLWFRILSQISKKSGVNLFEKHNGHDHKPNWDKPSKDGKTIRERAVQVEDVKKSVSNYLAKYLGKIEGKQKYNLKDKKLESIKSRVFPPSRWWSCSRDAKELAEKYTKTIPLNPVVPVLVDECTEFTENICNSFDCWTKKTINPYTKQQIGIIARGKYADVLEMAEILSGILNEVCATSRQVVDIHYKECHSTVFKRNKELDLQRQEQAFIEYIDAQGIPHFMRRRSEKETHRRYHEAIKSGHTMRDAFLCAGMN